MAHQLMHRDLGDLDGSVVIFGGPYSNLQATRALVAEARQFGINPSHMICTGDVVAYSADGPETVAAIRALGCAVVAGNCERQLAEGALDCGCGFEAGSTCDLLSVGWFAHANRTLGVDDRKWMATCPDIVTFNHREQRSAVIHGGLSDISRFLWPVSPKAAFTREIDCIVQAVGPVDRVYAGHCCVAFACNIAGVSWINAGAIGLPPNDGRPETRFAVLQDNRTIFHSLSYDFEAAAQAMQHAGLTQGYHHTLRTGDWPSEDVLPVEMRRKPVDQVPVANG